MTSATIPARDLSTRHSIVEQDGKRTAARKVCEVHLDAGTVAPRVEVRVRTRQGIEPRRYGLDDHVTVTS